MRSIMPERTTDARRGRWIAALAAVLVAGLLPAGAAVAEDDPAPVLGGMLYSTGGEVTVEVLAASAGLTSQLWLLEPEKVSLASNREVGRSVVVGPYPQGTELVFGIRVQGHEFRLGAGERNPDGQPHAVVDFGPDGCAVVGFEDLYGGGDRDYDDNRFLFCGAIASEPVEEEPSPPADPVRPPLASAGPDQTVDEGTVVTLDGSGSKASVRPAIQPSEEVGNLPGGTSLGVSLSALDVVDGVPVVKGQADVGQGPAAQNTSVAYVLDVSGSTGDAAACGGDANGDGRSNTVLDCEIAAAIKLHEEVVASGTVDKVAVIQFSTSAQARDLDPTSGTATLVAPDADKDEDGILDVVEGLRALRASGGTNFAPAAQTACRVLATTGSANLLAAFLSDGAGSGTLSSVVPCDPPVVFQSFAAGRNSDCLAGRANQRLDDLSRLSGGTCRNVPDVAELPDILPEVIASEITKVEYTLDGGDPVDVSAALGLPLSGPAARELELALPADLAGSHELCVTVTGVDAGGTSAVTTCSEVVTISGELDYQWRVVESDGPQVMLSSRSTAHPSFIAPDDGRYVLELTVTDGTGGTASDRVVVEVANVDPVLEVRPGASYAGGVTQIAGTLTDVGWQDTHEARVVWGDGTTDTVPVRMRGAGWGTFVASHVYGEAGAYGVKVTLVDDDGGKDAVSLEGFDVQTPVAVWANSASASPALKWAGGSGVVKGRVHSNGTLRIDGARKTVVGPTTYAGELSADLPSHSFEPAPTPSSRADFPFTPTLADYQPDGPVARSVGAAYSDMSSQCQGGTWRKVQKPLPDGVYYSSCDIALNGADIGGRVTLVSAGRIKIAGSRPAFEPFHDGYLMIAGASGSKAIDVAASSSKFLGTVFAERGEISISGARNRFFCGILGDRISITGSELDVRGAMCGGADDSVAAPTVVPDLEAVLSVDKDEALPSDSLDYELKLTHRGTLLVVPTLVGLENVDTASANVSGWTFGLERQEAVTGRWMPLATRGDESLKIHTLANDFPGVTYGADGAVVGTTLAPGGWATWGVEAALDLTPEQSALLFDADRTSGLRTRVDFTLAPTAVQTRPLHTTGEDFLPALRDLSPDVTDARATLVMPSGEATVRHGGGDDGIGTLRPGESVVVKEEWTVPVPAPRSRTETDAGYLARLRGADRTRLTGAAFVLAKGGVGTLVAPLSMAESTRRLPVVGVSAVGPDALPAGTSADYEVRLANLGSVSASAVATRATAASDDLALEGAPTALEAGESGVATTTYAAPVGATGPVPLRAEAEWEDARGNHYGVSGSTLQVARQVPGELAATLTDALHQDVDGNGTAGPGDVVRYALTLTNRGSLPLTGVSARVPVDARSVLLEGSGRTPDGGVLTLSEGVATAQASELSGGSSKVMTFDVRIPETLADGVVRLEVQGTVTADGREDVRTDDPALPGPADPTRTTVVVPRPALAAFLTGRLAVDADGNGTLTPGDTVAYELVVNSVGTQEVSAVRVAVPAPAGTTLLAESLTSSQGQVGLAGSGADARLGELGAYQSATVRFRARLEKPLPAATSAISAQAIVSSAVLADLVSDDPQTSEIGDPTVLTVGRMPGVPDASAPVVDDLAPADGTTVTAPVRITADLTAAAGTTLNQWVVDYRRADDTVVTVIGSGSGSAVDALLDPTLMPNGTYVVTVRATSSAGGLAAQEITVVVDGDLKLGRYTTTYADVTAEAAGQRVDVLRTYDSFDKSTGDFGVGWTLDLANFQVATNGPLGAGGWKMEGCGSGLIFVPLCFRSSKAHFVTVTWPDGRNEVFDLTPAEGTTFLSGLTSAKFTGRTGATSTLRAEDEALFFSNGDLKAGLFGVDGLYDPQRFVLTDKAGTRYTLKVGVGLVEARDRHGNVTEVDDRGILLNGRRVVLLDRDGQGRITQVTDAAGKSVRYEYDARGDLVRVTDRDGRVVDLAYRGNHHLESSSIGGQRPLRTMSYDDDGRLVSVTDGAGNTVSVDVDLDARVETVSGPDPDLTTIREFDERGNAVKESQVFDGRVLTSSFEHDESGLVTKSTDALGHTSTATYDDKGNVTRLTDRDGAVTDLSYNTFGQPLEYKVGGELKQKLSYNDVGDLVKVEHGTTGESMTLTYDGNGRLVSVNDGTRSSTTTYGPDGHPKKVVEPHGTTEYTFNANGELTALKEPSGDVLRYGHDEAGRLVSFEDGLGRVTRYAYDDAGRLSSETDPRGKQTRYTYDAAGRLRTKTDRNGVVTTVEYGPDGQMTRRSASDGTATRYQYDPAGRLVRAENDTAVLEWTWDDLSRPLTETLSGRAGTGIPTVVTHRSWTPGGQLASVGDHVGRTTYGYDDQGRLSSLKDEVAGTFTFGYDAVDRLTRLSRPNGLVTSWSYVDGQVGEQVTRRGTTVVDSVAVTRDAAGYPRTVTDHAGEHHYTHDALGRLLTVDHPEGSGVADESYTYDAAGNRRSWGGNPAPAVQYDANNRLLSDGRFTYGYDDAGRLTSRTSRANGDVTRLTWDGADRLRAVTQPGTDVAYEYDPLGRRISTTVDAATTYTAFVGDNPRMRLGADESLIGRYVHGLGADGILAAGDGSEQVFPLGDPSGTVRATTDGAGAIADRFSYDSFGNATGGTSAASPHGFHGFEQDPIGFYDAFARTYDPTTGRFLSEDPLAAENLYTYAFNSPMRVHDPTGQAAMVEYGNLTARSASVAKNICSGGAVTANLLMDVAVEVAVLSALGPLAGQGGIYMFHDLRAEKPYVGRSVDVLRRLNEHLRAGRINDKSVIKVLSGLTDNALPAAEQLAINGCGGKGNMANRINAVSKGRWDKFKELDTLLDGLL